ncbi:DUF2975 domain-containing protein [Lactococcus lactis]|uniref:DUF2975 domain-containing protein n=1 Tax=Lactococcus lactis TaxID=1358 RepID=UPI00398F8099
MKADTKYLKLVIIVIVLFLLFIFSLLVVGLIKSYQNNDIYFDKILFYVAMYLALILSMVSNIIVYSLLTLIDRDILFTDKAIKRTRLVRSISILIFFSLIGIMPMVWHIVELTNVTGVIPIAIIIIVSPLILSTFIGVFEKLLKRMVQIKSENDLTV